MFAGRTHKLSQRSIPRAYYKSINIFSLQVEPTNKNPQVARTHQQVELNKKPAPTSSKKKTDSSYKSKPTSKNQKPQQTTLAVKPEATIYTVKQSRHPRSTRAQQTTTVKKKQRSNPGRQLAHTNYIQINR